MDYTKMDRPPLTTIKSIIEYMLVVMYLWPELKTSISLHEKRSVNNSIYPLKIRTN